MQKSMGEQWLDANPWAVPARGARDANAAFQVVEAASKWINDSLKVPPRDPVHFALLDLVTIALKRWETDGIDPFTLYNVAATSASEGELANGSHLAQDDLAGQTGEAGPAGVSSDLPAGVDDAAGADETIIVDDQPAAF